jgi:hypothetical protein
VVAQNHHGIVIVPNVQNSNVPSGTCLDETSGLFAALNLDENTQLHQDRKQQIHLEMGNPNPRLFTEQGQHSAFALTPQK